MIASGAGASRRALLIGLLGTGGLALCPRTAHAQAATAPAVFRATAADVRPLAANGGGGAAAVIARLMPGELATALGSHLDPGAVRAPTLVARIDHILLSGYADAPSVGIDSLGQLDSIDGAGLVVAGRQVLSSTPMRASLPAGYSGAWYLPDIDERRIASLCTQFASWLVREMNL